MKINVQRRNDSDSDCRRYTFFAVVDGKEFTLAAAALGTRFTIQEIEAKARGYFGWEVEIEYAY